MSLYVDICGPKISLHGQLPKNMADNYHNKFCGQSISDDEVTMPQRQTYDALVCACATELNSSPGKEILTQPYVVKLLDTGADLRLI